MSATAVVPVAIEKPFLAGKGLVAGDPTYPNEDGVTLEAPIENSSHTFFEGKLTVAVYESAPAKVRIDNAPFDEFVQILEGRLILTLDDGREFKFEQGDSLVVPKGFSGYWEMPESYRELIIIDTIPSGSEE